jgi:hypothetical protein
MKEPCAFLLFSSAIHQNKSDLMVGLSGFKKGRAMQFRQKGIPATQK